jgi:putative tryptophan/tyrosine transport system substrate-binding protein
MGTVETAPDWVGLRAVLDRLKTLGWTEGITARIDVRWSKSDLGLMRENVQALLALSPDVILCHSNPALAQLRPLAGSTPIVFVMVAVQMLTEIAPQIAYVGVLMHPETNTHLAFWREAEAAAHALRIETHAAGIHTAEEIEQAITTAAARPNRGLVVLPHTVTEVHRDLIIALAARWGLPSMHTFRAHPMAGAPWPPTVLVSLITTGQQQITSTASSRVPNQPTCRCKRQPNSSWSSTSDRQGALTIPNTLLVSADEVIE